MQIEKYYLPKATSFRPKDKFERQNFIRQLKTCYFYTFKGKQTAVFIQFKMKKKESANIMSHATGVPNAENAEAYFKAQVRHPGLFFCIDKPEQWEKTARFIQKVLKEFPRLKVLAYFSYKKPVLPPEAEHLTVIDKNDFNWLRKEKPTLKSWLRKNQFDLLLVFVRQHSQRCKKLTFSIHARLKAGPARSETEQWCDITLENKQKDWSYDQFYNDLKIYFKQLNIKLHP